MRNKLCRIALAGFAAALAAGSASAAEWGALETRNCHEMTEAWFGDTASLQSLDADPSGAALAEYFAAREADYHGEARLFSEDAAPVSDTVAAESVRRAAGIAELESRLDMEITDAAVTVRVDGERGGVQDDGTRVVYAYEWTFFDYDDLSDGPGGSDVTGYGTWHRLTLAADGGEWRIVSDEYDESDLLGLSTLEDDTRAEFEALRYVPMEESAAVLPEGAVNPDWEAEDAEFASLMGINYAVEYNVADAIAYSEKYVWHGASGGRSYEDYYNIPGGMNYDGGTYVSFNSVGGDCANFTSQSINAGHMRQIVGTIYGSDGWFYKTSSNRSGTWASSTMHRRWMAANRGNLVSNLTAMTAAQVSANVFPGSPVYYSTKRDGTWQHTVLCVGHNSTGRPYINSHNHDRWHAVWNYYTSTGQIDTVQLTSDNFFGDVSGYQDEGDDFYAELYNPAYGRYVTNEGGGHVTARTDRTEDNGQIWHFERMEDQSYRITSTLDGWVLAVEGGGYLSRTAVRMEEPDGTSGQEWYLYYPQSNLPGYLMRPACTDRVLDLPNGSEYEEGTGLWTFGRNDINGRTGVEAQLYEVRHVSAPTPEPLAAPVVTVNAAPYQGEGVRNVTVSWEAVAGAERYTVRITTGGQVILSETVTETAYAFSLSEGNFEAVAEAEAADGRTAASTPAAFTVVKASGPSPTPTPVVYTVSYDLNGGDTDRPQSQTKQPGQNLRLSSRVPARMGFAFVNWNTEPDGSGDSYAVRAYYEKNESVTLYAQWEAESYTVAFDARGGLPAPENRTMAYGGLYGELPAPKRTGYQFLGWYMTPDSADDEAVTAESEMNRPENHTLYARWEAVELPDTVTVSFDANGGPSAPGSRIIAYGGAYGELPVTAWDGYRFLGWSLDAEGAETVTAATAVTVPENHTLYALWEETDKPAESPSLAAVVTRADDFSSVAVTAVSMPPDAVIFAAGYRNGQMADVAVLEQGSADITLKGIFDTVKVMALDGADTMRPLCAAAVITEAAFRDVVG